MPCRRVIACGVQPTSPRPAWLICADTGECFSLPPIGLQAAGVIEVATAAMQVCAHGDVRPWMLSPLASCCSDISQCWICFPRWSSCLLNPDTSPFPFLSGANSGNGNGGNGGKLTLRLLRFSNGRNIWAESREGWGGKQSVSGMAGEAAAVVCGWAS